MKTVSNIEESINLTNISPGSRIYAAKNAAP